MKTKLILVTGVALNAVVAQPALVFVEEETTQCQSVGHPSYTVPFIPNEKFNHTKFNIEPLELTLSATQGESHLTYKLPPELVGTNQEAQRFTGGPMGNGLYKLSINRGWALCSFPEVDRLHCVVDYEDDLSVDLGAVEHYLSRYQQNPEEHVYRKQVAQAFSTDPIGVMEATVVCRPRHM